MQAQTNKLIGAVAVAVLAAVGTGDSKAEPQATNVATYRARVVEVYADKAIIEIDGRRFLLEPIAPGQAFPATSAPISRSSASNEQTS